MVKLSAERVHFKERVTILESQKRSAEEQIHILQEQLEVQKRSFDEQLHNLEEKIEQQKRSEANQILKFQNEYCALEDKASRINDHTSSDHILSHCVYCSLII